METRCLCSLFCAGGGCSPRAPSRCTGIVAFLAVCGVIRGAFLREFRFAQSHMARANRARAHIGPGTVGKPVCSQCFFLIFLC